MAGKVGEAFVEIVADYSKFIRKAQTELNRALRELATKAKFTELTEAAGDAGEQAGEQYSDGFDRSVRRTATRRRRNAREDGRSTVRNLFQGMQDEDRRRGNFVTRLFGNIGKGAAGALQAGLGVFTGAASAGGGLLSGVFGAIGKELSGALDPGKILATGTKVAALIFVLPHLISAAHAAGSAIFFLAGNLLLLPGVLATVGIAMGVVQLAFSGFGEAVEALASGDLKKIEEALKDLPPAMQQVARETAATLVPAFEQIRSAVQESFFRPLKGAAQQLVLALGPIFAGGLSRIANRLGVLFRQIIDKLSSPRGQQFFDTLLKTVERIITQFGGPLLRLFGAIGKAFEASLPFVETLFRLLGKGFDRFSAWISEQVESGALEEFLLSALETGKDFIGVIEQLLELFGALFDDTEEGGQQFLKDITEALKLLTDFFKSPEGKFAIRVMIALAKDFGRALVFAADVFIRIIRLARATKEAIEAAFNWLIRLIAKAVGITGIGAAVGRAVGGTSGSSFAVGGIVTRPTRALIGEAGPEVVIPLTNRSRAQELMADTGLVSLAKGMRDGGGGTTVVVYLGTQQITDILDTRVEKGLARQAKAVSQGARSD